MLTVGHVSRLVDPLPTKHTMTELNTFFPLTPNPLLGWTLTPTPYHHGGVLH